MMSYHFLYIPYHASHPWGTNLGFKIGITNFIYDSEAMFFVEPLCSNIADVNIYLGEFKALMSANLYDFFE